MEKTKKPVKKAVKKETDTRRGLYTLDVSVNDVEYKGSANSLEQALSDFVVSPSFPFGVKTRVFLKFSDGEKSGSQRYGALVARRVFSAISHKPSAVEILASKMEARMA